MTCGARLRARCPPSAAALTTPARCRRCGVAQRLRGQPVLAVGAVEVAAQHPEGQRRRSRAGRGRTASSRWGRLQGGDVAAGHLSLPPLVEAHLADAALPVADQAAVAAGDSSARALRAAGLPARPVRQAVQGFGQSGHALTRLYHASRRYPPGEVNPRDGNGSNPGRRTVPAHGARQGGRAARRPAVDPACPRTRRRPRRRNPDHHQSPETMPPWPAWPRTTNPAPARWPDCTPHSRPRRDRPRPGLRLAIRLPRLSGHMLAWRPRPMWSCRAGGEFEPLHAVYSPAYLPAVAAALAAGSGMISFLPDVRVALVEEASWPVRPRGAELLQRQHARRPGASRANLAGIRPARP